MVQINDSSFASSVLAGSQYLSNWVHTLSEAKRMCPDKELSDESVAGSHHFECVHNCCYKVLPSRQVQYVADTPGTPYPVTNSIAFQAEYAKLE